MNTSGNSPHSRAEAVPDLLSLSPAMADRAWQRWLADRDPLESENLATLASYVSYSIAEWRLNAGKDGEQKSRENLATHVAAFKASLAAD